MQTGGFEHSSQPRSVALNRTKYREAPVDNAPQNIMYDHRVKRGSTYSQHVKAKVQRSVPQTRPKRDVRHESLNERPCTPPAVDGRQHIDVQTDNYLEELCDKVPELDNETQTDAFMDRPPLPLYIPTKIGVDVNTQIEDGDLFDFDLEVEPILEVLVGKTLEVSMMEVLEEEEMKQIRQHQDDFEQARNAELAEVQRLEAGAKRKHEEKDRRIKQAKAHVIAQSDLEEKVAARSFAKHHLSDLHSTVFRNLMDSGHFYDPLHKEVTDTFMPFLLQAACNQVEQIVSAQSITDALLSSAIERMNTQN